jgi:hypothetical protein
VTGYRIEREVEMYATNIAKNNQVHEHQCIELNGEFVKHIESTASALSNLVSYVL